MASLGLKDGVYHIRFRLHNAQYKKSLKTRDRGAAQAALHVVELTLHRLLTGQLALPPDVDPGDFVVSGGTRTAPVAPPVKAPPKPTTAALMAAYLEANRPLQAPSYHASQAMHLRHLARYLGGRADEPCDRVTFRDLDAYLLARLAERHPNTAERERVSLIQFYKWAARHGHVPASPAADLARIKGGVDRPPFRTPEQVEAIIARGGLTADEVLDMWECLYLRPPEIAGLLRTVRANAAVEYSYLSAQHPRTPDAPRRSCSGGWTWTWTGGTCAPAAASSPAGGPKPPAASTCTRTCGPSWRPGGPGGGSASSSSATRGRPSRSPRTGRTGASGPRCGARAGASTAAATGSRSASTHTVTVSRPTWPPPGWTSGSSTSSWAIARRACERGTATSSPSTGGRPLNHFGSARTAGHRADVGEPVGPAPGIVSCGAGG